MAAGRFSIDMGWTAILSGLGIEAQDVLRHADLPLDLLQRDAASVSTAEYFRLWHALDALSDDPEFALTLVEILTPDVFSPVLFACLCSGSMNAALDRLAAYKPIIGPMELEIDVGTDSTSVAIRGLPGAVPPPANLMAFELAFFVQLARLGLRDKVVPLRVETPVDLAAPDAMARWFGVRPRTSETARVVFDATDAARPFLTASPAMWAAFEPSLKARLADTTRFSTMRDRLSAWLNEAIPSGDVSKDTAARALGVSGRTLQRRLAEEGSNFQAELARVREALARYYLSDTTLSTGEIAFLLGYVEQNSFYRAFSDWTGTTPEAFRRAG